MPKEDIELMIIFSVVVINFVPHRMSRLNCK